MPSVLSTDALTTLSNLKDALNINSADTGEDNHLERLINRATNWIESETERRAPSGHYGLKARLYNGASGSFTIGGTDTIANEDYVYFSGSTKDQGGDTLVDPGTGDGIFYLPAWPVLANSALAFELALLDSRGSSVTNGESWDANVYTEWDDYVVDRERGVLRLLGCPFYWGFRNYRVTMGAGYRIGSAQPYVPADLEELCVELARMLYRDTKNVRSESVAGVSRTFNDAKDDPFVAQTLARYRRFSL